MKNQIIAKMTDKMAGKSNEALTPTMVVASVDAIMAAGVAEDAMEGTTEEAIITTTTTATM
jgi:hypothetical protein